MLVFGWIAGGLGVVYNIPQIYYIWKSKTVKGISFYSLMVRLISYFFYIAHGFTINDPPLIWMTSITLLQVSFICMQYYLYKTKKNNTTVLSPSINGV